VNEVVINKNLSVAIDAPFVEIVVNFINFLKSESPYEEHFGGCMNAS
jgi:hypothetical protein